MTLSDRYDLPLTTSSAAAADRYIEGLDISLAGGAGAEEHLQAAVELDQGFALAHVALARTLQFRGDLAGAKAAVARAQQIAPSLTPREQGHVAVLATAIAGDPAGALSQVRTHIAAFPRDAFVLSQATGVYGLIGFSGRVDRDEEQLALLDPLADAYGDDWWFLAAHGFALNESLQHEAARQKLERSLANYLQNGHASHGLAHVFFETGDAAAGASFLNGWLIGYPLAATLHVHLHWHLALFELARGNNQRVMELYDQKIRPAAVPSFPLGKIADAASLLWRCQASGAVDGPLPWDDVATFAAGAFARAGVTFGDMHCALAFSAAKDEANFGRLLGELKQRLAERKAPAGECTVAIAEGAHAFANGDYEEAVRQLEPIQDQVIRIGGSHAQREVFEDTLLEAYLRAGQHERAEALLRKRLARRSTPRDLALLQRAGVPA